MEQELFWEKMRKMIREEVVFCLKTFSMTDKKDKVYTITEVCTQFQISKPTLYEWIRAGKIKPVKIGRRVFFNRKEVEGLLG